MQSGFRPALVLAALAAAAASLSASSTAVMAAPGQAGNAAAPNGVYTAAQAERGGAAYLRNCSRCHRTDLSGDEGLTLNGELYQTLGPSLKGTRFFADWGHGSANRLFRKIRDTMPPDFQSIVDDTTKIDIVAFLLHENGFPDGVQELTRDAETLEAIPIVAQGDEHAAPPNFAVVQAVGCLAAGPDSRWILTNTSTPISTRDGPSTPAELKKAAAQLLGVERIVLVNVTRFDPTAHDGHKMEAKGLLYREPGENRITLSSLEMLASACTK
jgi:Cytochrome C oxidase, cbb3-type, subunit III